MATLITLADGTVPVAADFNANWVAINTEVRPAGTGGTGQSGYTTGDTLYASATNTISRLAAGSTGNGLVMIAGVPAWRPVYVEQLTGLAVSNGTDASNDWDIAAGAATSEESTVATRMLMVNTATLTKQVDAAWTAGSALGGLDTGAVANTTYHTHLIMRPDTGVVDALFSLSATAPTMPTSYTKSRRIASFTRAGGVNAALHQYGDEFWYDTPPTLSTNATNPGTTAVTETMAIPIGVKFQAILNVAVLNVSNVNVLVYLSSLDSADVAPSATAAPLGSVVTGTNAAAAAHGGQVRVWTSTAAQIRSRLNTSGAADTLRICTLGWLDRRGRA